MSLTINSFGNNSIFSLFGGGDNTTNNTFGLGNSLGDLALIKSGAYGKLTKAYYTKLEADGTRVTDKFSKSPENTASLNSVRNDTSGVVKATDELLSKDKNSIWNQIEVEDEDGNKTMDYDKDKIYDSISKFTKAYNDLVDSGQEANHTGVLTQIAAMVTTSSNAARTLGKAGITIDKDNHLNVDEDFLKNKANMTYVKDLFNGTGSYAYQIATKSSMANSYASSQLADITGRKAYTNTGSFEVPTSDMMNMFNKTT